MSTVDDKNRERLIYNLQQVRRVLGYSQGSALVRWGLDSLGHRLSSIIRNKVYCRVPKRMRQSDSVTLMRLPNFPVEF